MKGAGANILRGVAGAGVLAGFDKFQALYIAWRTAHAWAMCPFRAKQRGFVMGSVCLSEPRVVVKTQKIHNFVQLIIDCFENLSVQKRKFICTY